MKPEFEKYLTEERQLRDTKNYLTPLRYLEAHAKKELFKLSGKEIRQLIIDVSTERNHSEKMRYKIAVMVQQYLYWCRREGYTKTEYKCEFRKGQTKEPYFVSEEDFEKVLYGQPYPMTIRDFVMLKLLWDSGVRRAELAHLDCEDINLSEQTVHVRQGKGGKSRYTAFSADLIPMMKILMEQNKRLLKQGDMFGGPLFLSEKGNRLDKCSVSKHISKLGKNVGVHLYPHALRHSLAGRIISNGGDVLFVQRLLGHSTASQTSQYTHLSKEQIQKLYTRHAKSA